VNTVKKGANRATAAARTNRHAQRTPLPPRPGDVAAAREVIDSLSGLQAEIVEATLSAVEASDPRSHSKAQAFAERAVAAKWEASTALRPDGVELTLRRGPETIVQLWKNGVWQYAESIYAHGDRVTKPRNASGALKLLGRSPEDAATDAAKVASNKSFRKAEPRDLAKTLETAQASLPFAPHDADEIVLAALAGHSLSWFNRLSRKEEEGIVAPGRHLRLIELDGGERVLMFCCPRTGFRSCLLSQILAVGGKYAVKES
jgi:hypothetical protein